MIPEEKSNEKTPFNKIIKEQMLAYGFEKTETQDYAKEALDGITKIIVRVPDAPMILPKIKLLIW
jgi:hypothetical protein